MPEYSELLNLIQAETALGEELQKSLIAERRQLESRNLGALQAILSQKAELLIKIESAREARNKHLLGLGLDANLNALREQLNAASAGHEQLIAPSDQLVAACIDGLTECNKIFNLSKQYNELNGLLIVSSRKRNHQKLDILKGVHLDQKLYDAKGQAAKAGASQGRKLG